MAPCPFLGASSTAPWIHSPDFRGPQQLATKEVAMCAVEQGAGTSRGDVFCTEKNHGGDVTKTYKNQWKTCEIMGLAWLNMVGSAL